MVLPSFCIIFAVSFILRRFEGLAVIRYAFSGIRAGVLALIVRALVSMYRQCPKGVLSYLLMGAAFLSVAFFKVNVMLVIAGCAAVGLVSALAAKRRDAP